MFPSQWMVTLLVDGVLASCYSSIDHDLAHIGMTPMRWITEITDVISSKEKGISVYMGVLEALGMWVFSSEHL